MHAQTHTWREREAETEIYISTMPPSQNQESFKNGRDKNIYTGNYNIYLLKNDNFYALKNRNIGKEYTVYLQVFTFSEHLFSISEYKKFEKTLLRAISQVYCKDKIGREGTKNSKETKDCC